MPPFGTAMRTAAARRAGRAAIRVVLAWWAIVSFAVTVAGVSLDHPHLTGLGIAILAAALAGLAVGLPLPQERQSGPLAAVGRMPAVPERHHLEGDAAGS